MSVRPPTRERRTLLARAGREKNSDNSGGGDDGRTETTFSSFSFLLRSSRPFRSTGLRRRHAEIFVPEEREPERGIQGGKKKKATENYTTSRRQTWTTSTATIRVGAGRVLCRTNESSMAPGGFPAARSLLFTPFHASLFSYPSATRRYSPPAASASVLVRRDATLRYRSFDSVAPPAPPPSRSYVSDGHFNTCHRTELFYGNSIRLLFGLRNGPRRLRDSRSLTNVTCVTTRLETFSSDRKFSFSHAFRAKIRRSSNPSLASLRCILFSFPSPSFPGIFSFPRETVHPSPTLCRVAPSQGYYHRDVSVRLASPSTTRDSPPDSSSSSGRGERQRDDRAERVEGRRGYFPLAPSAISQWRRGRSSVPCEVARPDASAFSPRERERGSVGER